MKKLLIASLLVAAGAGFAFSAEPAIGKKAPSFTLMDTNGEKVSLDDLKGQYVVLEWINLGCPFVKKHYDTDNMQKTQDVAIEKGAIWLSICSSAKGKQGHMSPDEWNESIEDKGINSSAVLIDESGEVGKMYMAKTTPHMFIIDPKGVLIYKGAIDDKPSTDKEDIPGATNYVLAALDEAMEGKPVSVSATKPYGCSVKY